MELKEKLEERVQVEQEVLSIGMDIAVHETCFNIYYPRIITMEAMAMEDNQLLPTHHLLL